MQSNSLMSTMLNRIHACMPTSSFKICLFILFSYSSLLGNSINLRSSISQADDPYFSVSVYQMACPNGTAPLYKAVLNYDNTLSQGILIDWPFDGLGLYDDPKSVFFNQEGAYTVYLQKESGEVIEMDFTTTDAKIQEINPKDLILSSTEELSQGQFMFHLDDAMNIEFGDIDNDHADGSVFKVSYYTSEEKALAGIDALPMEYPSIGEEMLIVKVEAEDCYEMSQLMLRRADICVKLDISEACEGDNLIPLIPHLCRTSPLDPKEYLPLNGTFNILQFDTDLNIFVQRNDLLECTPTECFIRVLESASYQIEYSYTNAMGIVDMGVALLEVQDPNSQLLIIGYEYCNDVTSIVARANPEGGTLSGAGIASSFVDGNETFYFIDATQLSGDTKYVYTYKYEQVQGSTLICSIESKDSIFVLALPDIEIQANLNNICEGNDVMLTAINNSPTQTLTYEWYNNSGVLLATGINYSIDDIEESTSYTLKAISDNGCEEEVTRMIEVFESPEIVCDVVTSLQCYGDTNGSGEVLIIGNNIDYNDYTITWQDGTLGNTISGLSAGDYLVSIVENATQCESQCVLTITEPGEIDLILPLNITSNLDCFGDVDASVVLSITGGTPPFMYSKDNITYTSSGLINDLPGGDFSIYVRDANGCQAQVFGSIPEPPELMFESVNDDQIECFNDQDGQINVEMSGGTSPYTYAWSNDSNSAVINNLDIGNYVVTVTDANGCSISTAVVITQPDLLRTDLITTGKCLNFDVTVAANTSGGTAPYTHNWSLLQAGSTGINETNNFSYNADRTLLTINTIGAQEGGLLIRHELIDANGCAEVKLLAVEIENCFDLAIRKTTTSNVAYLGDEVRFAIEVINQGEIPAYNVKIQDTPHSDFIYRSQLNTSFYTQNANDWDSNGGVITYTIDEIAPNSTVTIYIYLEISSTTTAFSLTNVSEIIEYSDGVVMNPVDEDDPIDCPTQVEVDDEISDDSNGSSDNPCDDDQLDAASVIICGTAADLIELEYCLTSSNLAACYDISGSQLNMLVDPTGNGDGIANGDAGNLVASFHNSATAALNNSGVINPCISSAGTTNLFARLVSPEGCIFAIPIRVETAVLPEVTSQPLTVSEFTGADIEFKVSATGQNLMYQWQILENGSFVDIPLAITDSYTISDINIEDDGIEVRVFIKNALHPECNVTSQVARLNVIDDFMLVCNDLVNISLSSTCDLDISLDLVLQGGGIPHYLILEVYDQDNNLILPPYGESMIGNTYTVKVIDPTDNNNSCWSQIYIEDKLAPEIICPADLTVWCSDLSSFPLPGVEDNCDSFTTVYEVSNEYEDVNCDNSYNGVRYITYRAEDAYGNISEDCTRTIYYNSLSVDDVIIPLNRDNVISPSYNCDNTRGIEGVGTGPSAYSNTPWDLNGNDYPDPTESGSPTAPNGDPLFNVNTFCALEMSYNDQVIELCGSNILILRSWNIVDWCSGKIRKEYQTIRIHDVRPPIVICQEDNVGAFNVSITHESCSLNWTVEPPVNIFDCSETTWTVAYLNADESGNPPVDVPYTDENVTGTYPNFTIENVPLGRTWLRYTVVDACGNMTNCFTELDVVDNTEPFAICDANTVVTLYDGTGKIEATSIDDGSFDICGHELVYGIRKMTNTCSEYSNERVLIKNIPGVGSFYDAEFFCCDDTGGNVLVELMVMDMAGNYSRCMANVVVRDIQEPVFTYCPPDVTVNCNSYNGEDLFGQPEVSDNCGFTNVTVANSGQINNCGIGSYTRSWTLRDATGNSAFCSQTVSIIDLNPYNGPSTSQWPKDVTLNNTCLADTDPSNAAFGYPVITDSACRTLASTYSDEVFNNSGGACYRIIRHWTVIDWCQFDQATGSGQWTHSQEIKINNTIAPNILCNTRSFCIESSGCSTAITYIKEATDDCTEAQYLAWSYEIDLDNDNDIDITGQGNDISGVYNKGNHRVYWTVEDACGNTSTCDDLILIRDCTPPTPYCISGATTVIMPSSGSISIWASDFDLGSSDNCEGTLRYSFSENLNETSLSFDCDDLGLHTVEMWVTDEAANQSFCTVELMIQSNVNSGCDEITQGITFAGRITTEVGESIDSVSVSLSNMSLESPLTGSMYVDTLSRYAFEVSYGEYNFMIKADKLDSPLNGVSTLDLIMIQKHILGIDFLSTPYQLIAADVNESQSLSAQDLVILRKLILGVIDELPSGKSWTFVDENQSFADVNAPWPFMDRVELATPITNRTDLDMIGVKLGDVNGNAILNNASEVSSANRSESYVNLEVEDRMFAADEEYIVDFIITNTMDLTGMQFILNYDPEVLMFTSCTSDIISINENNVYEKPWNNGQLLFSWNDVKSKRFEADQIVFSMRFRTMVQSTTGESILGFVSKDIKSEAYDADLSTVQLNLSILNTNNQFEIYQNRPNPFNQNTEISYYNPSEELVKLKIYDSKGALIYQDAEICTEGLNTFEISKEQLQGREGILYYMISTRKYSKVKSMIIL